MSNNAKILNKSMSIDETNKKTPVEEAFDLETSLLTILLKRHHAQHRRALYFRHLSMTLKYLQNNSISHLSQVVRGTQLIQQARLVEYERSMSQARRRRRGTRGGTQMSKDEIDEQEEEDQWEPSNTSDVVTAWTEKVAPSPPLASLSIIMSSSVSNTSQNSEPSAKKRLEQSLAQHIQWLHFILTQQLPKLLRRIQNTSKMLLQEMAKGYFLPFCSVAIGTLARIRVILMRWGREGIMRSMDVISSMGQSNKLSLSCGLKETIMKHCYIDSNICMKSFMEVDTSWNPSQKHSDYKKKPRSKEKSRKKEESLNSEHEQIIMNEIEMSSMERKNQRDFDDSRNTYVNAPPFHKTTVDDKGFEDIGECVDVEISNILAEPLISNTPLSQTTEQKTTETNMDRNKNKSKAESIKSKQNDGEKMDRIETKTNVLSPLPQSPNHDQTNQKDIKTTKSETADNPKKRKKKKKDKSKVSKKKRKKAKGTKDIFDQIFDGL